MFVCDDVCDTRDDPPQLTLRVVPSSVQRGGLVAGALPGHRTERLHPQQLRGSIRLHPGRRVNLFVSLRLTPAECLERLTLRRCIPGGNFILDLSVDFEGNGLTLTQIL